MATEQNIADAAQRALQALGQNSAIDDLERLIPFARRMLAEQLGLFFTKEYTIAIVSGVGIVYNLAGLVNVDLIFTGYGRAVHEDTTEISILPPDCTSRDLTYSRFQGFYWAALESNANIVTITVWQADGASPAPDGNIAVDFVTVTSLANWPPHLDTHLVQRVVEMAHPSAAAV